MAHAIGCLGTAINHVRVERAKRAESVIRLAVPKRNQNRRLVVAVIDQGNKRYRLLPVREGHLRHVRAAMFHHEVKYLHKM